MSSPGRRPARRPRAEGPVVAQAWRPAATRDATPSFCVTEDVGSRSCDQEPLSDHAAVHRQMPRRMLTCCEREEIGRSRKVVCACEVQRPIGSAAAGAPLSVAAATVAIAVAVELLCCCCMSDMRSSLSPTDLPPLLGRRRGSAGVPATSARSSSTCASLSSTSACSSCSPGSSLLLLLLQLQPPGKNSNVRHGGGERERGERCAVGVGGGAGGGAVEAVRTIEGGRHAGDDDSNYGVHGHQLNSTQLNSTQQLNSTVCRVWEKRRASEVTTSPAHRDGLHPL